ncbi:Transcriptional repressor NF-X1 [Thoreauomyces humboldtii]|nr:Transcriptional repressor NF-X1 [Thoreauomyces humboldtii]
MDGPSTLQTPRVVRSFTSTGSGVVANGVNSTSTTTATHPSSTTNRLSATATAHPGSANRGGRAKPRIRKDRVPGGEAQGQASAGSGENPPRGQPSRNGRPSRAKIPLTEDSPIPSNGNAEQSLGTPSASGTPPRKRNPRIRKPINRGGGADAIVDGGDDLTASLINELSSSEYECMICYDTVKHRDKVWSCQVCYAVFHLRCVEKWGHSSAPRPPPPANGEAWPATSNTGWRCPGCQNVEAHVPHEYRCFCDKVLNPPSTQEKPCKAKVSQRCRCGNITAEVDCAASKVNIGHSSSTILPCDVECERLERNRKLAEALNIDPLTHSSAAGLPEYSESVLRYAYQNPVWVKQVEEQLAAFVSNPLLRVVHFPSGKGSAGKNAFLLELSKDYDLSADIIDADRKGLASVTIRKTAAKNAVIPSVLVSAAAAAWKPAAGSSSAASTKSARAAAAAAAAAATGKEHRNALHLHSLQFGMDARDLQLLLEPFFVCGTDGVTLSVRILPATLETRRDALVQLESARLKPEDLEALLVAVHPDVAAKFVGNTWARDATLCHVGHGGEVLLPSRPSMGSTASQAQARTAYANAAVSALPTGNAFASLGTRAEGKVSAAAVVAGVPVSTAVAPPPPPAPTPPPRPTTPDSWDQLEDLEESQ